MFKKPGLAIVLKTDGTFKYYQPKNNKSLEAEEIQEIIHGYFEPVRTAQGNFLLVDEDGTSKGLPVNVLASDIAGQLVVGDALYCDKKLLK